VIRPTRRPRDLESCATSESGYIGTQPAVRQERNLRHRGRRRRWQATSCPRKPGHPALCPAMPANGGSREKRSFAPEQGRRGGGREPAPTVVFVAAPQEWLGPAGVAIVTASPTRAELGTAGFGLLLIPRCSRDVRVHVDGCSATVSDSVVCLQIAADQSDSKHIGNARDPGARGPVAPRAGSWRSVVPNQQPREPFALDLRFSSRRGSDQSPALPVPVNL